MLLTVDWLLTSMDGAPTATSSKVADAPAMYRSCRWLNRILRRMGNPGFAFLRYRHQAQRKSSSADPAYRIATGSSLYAIIVPDHSFYRTLCCSLSSYSP